MGSEEENGPQVIRVIDTFSRMPLAGAQIQLGDGQMATTDAKGEVLFEAVQEPFSLHLSYKRTPSEEQTVRLIAQREDPVEIAIQGPEINYSEVVLEGRVQGFAGPGSRVVVAAFGSKLLTDSTEADLPSGNFELPVSWGTAGSQEITLVAFETESVQGSDAVRLSRYASTKLTLNASTAPPQLPDLVLSSVNQLSLAGTLAPPSTAGPMASLMAMSYGGVPLELGDFVPASPGAYELPFPQIEGVRAQLMFLHVPAGLESSGAMATVSRLVTPPSDGLDISFPAPVNILGPAAEEGLTATTILRWTSAETTGTYSVSLNCEDINVSPEPRVSIKLQTTAKELAVSSLPELAGLNFSSTLCDWYVAWHDERSASAWIRQQLADEHRSYESEYRELLPEDLRLRSELRPATERRRARR